MNPIQNGFLFPGLPQAKLVRYICKQQQCKLSVAPSERTSELNSYPRFSDWLCTFNVRPEVVQVSGLWSWGLERGNDWVGGCRAWGTTDWLLWECDWEDSGHGRDPRQVWLLACVPGPLPNDLDSLTTLMVH